ncbi:hypothetical protein BHE74_00017566, partial [Ensete ventricosum]
LWLSFLLVTCFCLNPECCCLCALYAEEQQCLNSELWHACAGPLVSLPAVGSRVVYFPQGHSEQVSFLFYSVSDYSQQPPAQELIARDLHGNEWKFRHIFRGEYMFCSSVIWSLVFYATKLYLRIPCYKIRSWFQSKHGFHYGMGKSTYFMSLTFISPPSAECLVEGGGTLPQDLEVGRMWPPLIPAH